MPDTSLSTDVTLSGGGASGYGTVAAPTSGQISNAQAAIDAMSVDIDTLLTGDVTVYLVPPSFFTANNWSAAGSPAWGYTPKAGKAFVNNTLSSLNQRYTILHEIGHSIDSARGVMNSTKRAAVAALMVPAPTVTSGYWSAGAYKSRPSECFGDTIPRAYAGITSPLAGSEYPGGYYYTRHVEPADYGAFRTAVGGAGGPAATTLAANVLAGATNIKVVSVTGFSAGEWIEIGSAGERHQIQTVGTSGSGGTGITLTTPMTLGYSTGADAVETGPPTDVSEGSVSFLVVANTPNGQRRSHTISGLASGASGVVEMRFFDGTAWGPFSAEEDVQLAVTPGKPVQLTVTPGTLTPDFGASLDLTGDPNDWITEFSIRVYQQLAGTNVAKMILDDQAVAGQPNRLTVAYSGNVGGPLAWDQRYVWAIQFKNKHGKLSPFSDFVPFTPTVDTGPLITYGGEPLDLSFKIDDLTPTFRLADRGSANIDQARLRIWNSTGTAILYDSGVVSFTSTTHRDITVPADILAYGLNVQVDGAIRVTGQTALGSFNAQKATVHINSQPGAPFPVSVLDQGQLVVPDGSLYRALGRTDGVWVTSLETPTLVFPYRDVDLDLGYEDDPNRREIELRDLADAHVGASPYVITADITDEWTIPASVLVADTTYKARARYDDSADVRSSFSSYLSLRYSVPPTLTSVTPADEDEVTDPTPTFSGTYDSDADKLMAAQQLVLRIAGAVIYDSGLVLATSPSLTVPRPYLDTDQTVEYSYYVFDSDGLFAVAAGTFTTAFVQAEPVTGLTVVPEEETKSFRVSWDATEEPNFEATLIYARTSSRQFRLVATITDPAVTEVSVLPVAHNRETIIRVTQTNGFAESEPTEASATLGSELGDLSDPGFIHGYWLVRPDVTIDLPNPKHNQGDTQTDLEVFSPPGRADKVILDWGTKGYEGSIRIYTTDRELIRTLRAWKETGVVSILKTPYGSVRFIRLVSTPDADQPAGWIDGQLSYIEIAPIPMEQFQTVT